VLAQFAGTSLWFAGNAVLPELQVLWHLPAGSLGYITSAVQLGFILGTLGFAFFNLADRFSPRILFFWCASLGAATNLLILAGPSGLALLLACRLLIGVFLAGIYPVGMKIAAGWYHAAGLGRALGFLIGALVLGTAFPQLVQGFGRELAWSDVVAATSGMAAAGGLVILLLVPDGPLMARSSGFDPRALLTVFRSPRFRAASFGYFGHMWELYAFWAFVPLVLAGYAAGRPGLDLNVPLWSGLVIAAGFVGCAAGGMWVPRLGSARVAFAQLAVSGLCCVISPLLFFAPPWVFLCFLLLWGITVVGDSPQFSALNAATAQRRLVGSALTIVNCIGFTITIFSVELLSWLVPRVGAPFLYPVLAFGPLLGLLSLRPLFAPAVAEA